MPTGDVRGLQFGSGNLQYNFWAATEPSLPRRPGEPRQIGRPPGPAVGYQPRSAIESKIRAILSGDSSRPRRGAILVGTGGVGKSQLAARAIEDIRASMDLVVWISATSRESIVTAFAEAQAATSPMRSAGHAADSLAAQFLNWLESTTERWIVVFDDVTDPAHVRQLWPRAGHGLVLATTQRRDLVRPNTARFFIDVFTRSESIGFLRSRLRDAASPRARRSYGPDADLRALGNELGRLPLALAQAAAVMANDGITAGEYRQRLADRTQSVADLFPADAVQDDYERTVANTWNAALESANRLRPQEWATRALQLASVLSPDGVPEAIWHAQPSRLYLSEASNGEQKSGSVADARLALRNLDRLSLIDHRPEVPLASVRTHGLVQRATRDSLSPEALCSLVGVAANALEEWWHTQASGVQVSQVLQQNVTSLLAVRSDALAIGRLHPILLIAGNDILSLGVAPQAVEFWRAAVRLADERLGDEHRDGVLARYGLAYALAESGAVADAIAEMANVYELRAQLLGAHDPETLQARHNLADWKGAAGDPAAAVLELQEILRLRLRSLGSDHPYTLATRHSLARWRGVSGERSEAAKAFTTLAKDRSRLLGEHHPDTLAARHSLASWWTLSGDAKAGLREFDDLLATRITLLGEEHPDTLTTRHDRARCLVESGAVREAIEEFESVLLVRAHVLGSDHPRTLSTYEEVADWRGELGEARFAREAFMALIRGRSKALGQAHPETTGARLGAEYWTAVAASCEEGAGAVHVNADLSRRWAEWRSLRWVTRWSSRLQQ